MRQFVIERDLPGLGKLSEEELKEAAKKSNGVLRELGPDIQWVQSYTTADRMFCIYLAKNEQIIHRHAELSGFPATKVTEIKQVVDPMTESR